MISPVYDRTQVAITLISVVTAQGCSKAKRTKVSMSPMGANKIPRSFGLSLDCVGFCGGDSVDGRRTEYTQFF